MAGLSITSSAWKRVFGTVFAAASLVSALILGYLVLERLDARPRTHDAFIYADTAALAPDVSGRILAIAVRDNDFVHAGQPLVTIDPEPYEQKLRQARAQVGALEAEIGLTGRQVAAQNAAAAAAAAQTDRARAQLALAKSSLGRIAPLQQPGFVTGQQVDEARSNVQQSVAAVQAAINQAQQARQAVGDTLTLQAQLRAAQAALALAERDRRLTTLLAPFDGYVVGLDIAAGTYAAAGHPLFTLVKAHDWYAIANFRETELTFIAKGDRATVWLMADGQHPIAGEVESTGWAVRPDDAGGPSVPVVGRTLNWVIVAQRFPVRIRLHAPPEAMMHLGATASVAITHAQHN